MLNNNGTKRLTKRSTVNDAIDAWIDSRRAGWKPRSEGGIRDLFTPLRNSIGDRRVTSVRREDVADLVVSQLADGITGNGLRARLYRWSVIFRWCVEDGVIAINPVQMDRLPPLPREQNRRQPILAAEKDKILAYLATPKRFELPAWWKTAVLIGYHTGLRISDISDLCWMDNAEHTCSFVDFNIEAISACPRKRSRDRQRVLIPMESELVEHLKELWASVERQDQVVPWVVPGLHFDFATDSRWYTGQFARIRKACGFGPEISFHSFRHGFVSRLLNADIHPITIASMTGQSEQMIRRYAHVSHSAKVSALAASRRALQDVRLAEMNKAAGREDVVR